MVQPATKPLADALGGAIEAQPVVAHVVRGGPAELAVRHLRDPRLADGLLVTRVAGGGAGEAAGLEPDDLLRVVNGRALRGRNAISEVRQAPQDHTPALLLVERDGLNRPMAAAPHHRASMQRSVAQRPRPPALSRVLNGR
jgi:S1-C subfamily serine protease